MTNRSSYAIERRRHPRTRLAMTLGCIRLDPDGGDVVDSLHMRDISRGGLGAYSARPYYPGQRIVLNLPIPADAGRRNVYATIVRCRQAEEGYSVGFAFDAPYVGEAYRYSRSAINAATPQAVAA
jgi:hypothetical protein